MPGVPSEPSPEYGDAITARCRGWWGPRGWAGTISSLCRQKITYFSGFAKRFWARDVAITLDCTGNQARPSHVVITRLVIEASGSVTQSIKSCHPRDPRIVVGSARFSRSNERTKLTLYRHLSLLYPGLWARCLRWTTQSSRTAYYTIWWMGTTLIQVTLSFF